MVTPFPSNRLHPQSHDPASSSQAGSLADAVRRLISGFEEKYLSRRPRRIGVYVMGDVLVARVHGILSPAEKQLATSPDGRMLMRQLLLKEIEELRDVLSFELRSVTGAGVLGVTVDLDPENDERVVVCRFDAPIEPGAPQSHERPDA